MVMSVCLLSVVNPNWEQAHTPKPTKLSHFTFEIQRSFTTFSSRFRKIIKNFKIFKKKQQHLNIRVRCYIFFLDF